MADLEERCLCLNQVSLAPDTGKFQYGAQSAVSFDRFGVENISVSDGSLQIRGRDGRLLLRLHLETTEEIQTWSRGLRAALCHSPITSEGSRGRDAPDAAAVAGGQADGGKDERVAVLKALIFEQEERIARLDELKRCKAEHLLKLHGYLEESLEVLQSNQKTYSEQNAVMEAQKAYIAKLMEALGASPAISAPPQIATAPAAAPAASAPATVLEASAPPPRATAAFAVAAAAAARVAAAKGPASPTAAPAKAATVDRPAAPVVLRAPAAAEEVDEDQDAEMMGLMRRTEELKAAAEAAKSLLRPGSLEAPPELLATLGALIKEKDELEARLRREQADLEYQLSSMQATQQ